MKTPTPRSGNGKNKRPPPELPPLPELDDLTEEPMLDLVAAQMKTIRQPLDGEADTISRAYRYAEAMHAKLTSTADPALLTPIERLNRDLREASRMLGRGEARFLVDAYYKMQEDRIRSAHQLRSLTEAKDGKPSEPHDVIDWLLTQEETLEKQIRTALDFYSLSDRAGIWARSIKGIGPVIGAGLLANIEIEKAPTVGHIWRFAGLDPSSLWIGTVKATELVGEVIKDMGKDAYIDASAELSDAAIFRIADRINVRGERMLYRLAHPETGDIMRARADVIRSVAKRPWNAGLKRLCYLIGESFVKVSNRPDDLYGKIYKARKDWETERNNRGVYADQAAASLAEKKFGVDTQARKHYEAGRLPPARIHMRAARRAVKLFLAHFHEVLYWDRYEQLPPHPWVLEHVPGHAHRIEVPNLELVPELQAAKLRGRKP